MKSLFAAIVCLALGFAVYAPSLNAQKRKPKAASAASVTPVPSPLDPTLADLERVSAATLSDLTDLKSEKHSRSWMTAWMFWRHESSTSQKTQQLSASLQRNLHDAVPGLIQDARNAGSFHATFKLYNDLSVVCETLDALVDSMKSDGRKGEGPLNNDATAMGRIRQELATFVEQKAAALDGTKPSLTWTAATATPINGKPKKIIIDDNIPAKSDKKTLAAQP